LVAGIVRVKLQIPYAATALAIVCCFSSLAAGQVTEEQLEKQARAALDMPVQFEFIETTLEDVAEFISDLANIDVALDTRALDDVGIGTDTPVTRSLKNITLRSALRLTLKDLELTTMIRDGALVITTPEEAETRLITRVYPVTDVVARTVDGKVVHDFDEMIELMTTHVQPEAWGDVGGPCSIEVALNSLVISSTEEIHEEVDSLLKQIRTLRKAVEESPQRIPAVSIGLRDSPATARIEVALRNATQLDFVDTPLNEVVDFLADKHSIPIVIDTHSLDNDGIVADEIAITMRTRETPLDTVLRRMLNEHELKTVIANEVLIITTAEEAEFNVRTRLYPINDLTDEAGQTDFDQVIQVMTSSVAPDSWEEVGGPGAIDALTAPASIVVSQTREVHQQIAKLLTALRANRPHNFAAEKREPELSFYVFKLRTMDAMNKPQPVSPEAAAKYAEIVKKAIGEKEWEVDGAVIEAADSSLIVRHYPRVARKIQGLLLQLNIGAFGGGPGMGGGFFRVPAGR
jgi:hypothetical protein